MWEKTDGGKSEIEFQISACSESGGLQTTQRSQAPGMNTEQIVSDFATKLSGKIYQPTFEVGRNLEQSKIVSDIIVLIVVHCSSPEWSVSQPSKSSASSESASLNPEANGLFGLLREKTQKLVDFAHSFFVFRGQSNVGVVDQLLVSHQIGGFD